MFIVVFKHKKKNNTRAGNDFVLFTHREKKVFSKIIVIIGEQNRFHHLKSTSFLLTFIEIEERCIIFKNEATAR